MTDGGLDELYRELVLDHHRSPRGRHALGRVDAAADGSNPTCGDEVRVELELDGACVVDVAIRCQGCAISVAAGSMLAELTRGKTVEEAQRLTHALQQLLRGEPLDTAVELGDLEALEGVRRFPTRVKCAALASVTLEHALEASRANGCETTEPRAPEEVHP